MNVYEAEYRKMGKYGMRLTQQADLGIVEQTRYFMHGLGGSIPDPIPIITFPSWLHGFRIVGRTTYFGDKGSMSWLSVLSGVTDHPSLVDGNDDRCNRHHIDASRFIIGVCRSLIQDRKNMVARIAWVIDKYITIVGAAVGFEEKILKFKSLQWDNSQWATFPLDADAETVAKGIADKTPTLHAE